MKKIAHFLILMAAVIGMAASCDTGEVITPYDSCINRDSTMSWAPIADSLGVITEYIGDTRPPGLDPLSDGDYVYVLDNPTTRAFTIDNSYYLQYGMISQVHLVGSKVIAKPIVPDCCGYFLNEVETARSMGHFVSYMFWCCDCNNHEPVWQRIDKSRR